MELRVSPRGLCVDLRAAIGFDMIIADHAHHSLIGLIAQLDARTGRLVSQMHCTLS